MFKKLQIRKDLNLLLEEKLYEYAAQEMDAGRIRKGLWAKASSEAISASEADIRRTYLKLRVDSLKAEGRIVDQFMEQIEAATGPMSRRERKRQEAIERENEKRLKKLERQRIEAERAKAAERAIAILLIAALLFAVVFMIYAAMSS
jgi:hypothetical protein